MTTMPRRLAQLEAKQTIGARRFAWRPDDTAPESEDAWLADLRRREGWAETDQVTIYTWAAPGVA